MVTDSQFASLRQELETVKRLLILKVLGNDISTNYGLPAQALTVGAVIAGSLTLTANGVTTVINNTTDPTAGLTESLSSTDNTVAHGDTSYVAPTGFVILSYDASIPGNKVIGFYVDDGTGTGLLQLSQVGSLKQITLENSTSNVTVTDGVNTGVYGATGFVVPAGSVSGNIDAATYSASTTPGITIADTPTSASFVTSTFIATNTISYTPGATMATYVSAVGNNTNTAITSPGFAAAGYKKGLRVS